MKVYVNKHKTECPIEGHPVLQHKPSHKLCLSNKDQVSSFPAWILNLCLAFQ